MAKSSEKTPTKATRKILLACMIIVVCIALMVAGTYALFTANYGVTNHLAAGNLSATLVRDNLETVTINESGNLTKTTDAADKDFSAPTSENLFGIENGAKIAPACSFTADMVLTNTGTVAFSYWIEVKLTGDSNKLAEQLKVTLKTDKGQTEKFLSEGLTVGSETEGIGIVVAKGSANFSVTVTFADLTANNDAQDQTVEFDFVVHAIQDATVTNA